MNGILSLFESLRMFNDKRQYTIFMIVKELWMFQKSRIFKSQEWQQSLYKWTENDIISKIEQS